MSTTTKAAQFKDTLRTHNWPFDGWETVVVRDDGFPLAVAVGASEEESRNHARLIAAAPEMLEALEGIQNVKFARECTHGEEYDYCDCCRHDWEKELRAARQKAEAAIQKAREVKS